MRLAFLSRTKLRRRQEIAERRHSRRLLYREIRIILMKGIVLAGGSGTRLYPANQTISNSCCGYDKPRSLSISILMLAGIRESSSSARRRLCVYPRTDGTGKSLDYRSPQREPRPRASPRVRVGAEFIGNIRSAGSRGNIFYGHELLPNIEGSA